MQPVPTPEQGIPVPPPAEPWTHQDGPLARSLKVLVGALLAYAVVTLTVLLVDIHRRSFDLGNGVPIDLEQLIDRDAAGFWPYPPALLLLVITALIFVAWPTAACRCSGCMTASTANTCRTSSMPLRSSPPGPATLRQPNSAGRVLATVQIRGR